jgi:DeoR family transcriptional regulator of aga operon
MIPAQRRKLILDILFDQGVVSVQSICERAGASPMTVRRDLDQLAREGLVVRSHGGASLVEGNGARASSGSAGGPAAAGGTADLVLRAKEAIGAAAAERIEEGQRVVFDGGIAGIEAARRVVARGLSITAITNSIKTAAVLLQSESVRLIVTGGTRMPGTSILHGDPGQDFIERIHADLALVSVQAIANGRMSDNALEIAAMKRRSIGAARRVILMADSWKFGGPALCDVGDLSGIDEIITDAGLKAGLRRAIRALGIALTLVRVAGHGRRA